MTDRDRRIRPLATRPAQPLSEEYRPTVLTEKVQEELRLHIDRLRDERHANDDRATRAAARNDLAGQAYWASRADGLSAGIAALRDALFHLTGADD